MDYVHLPGHLFRHGQHLKRRPPLDGKRCLRAYLGAGRPVPNDAGRLRYHAGRRPSDFGGNSHHNDYPHFLPGKNSAAGCADYLRRRSFDLRLRRRLPGWKKHCRPDAQHALRPGALRRMRMGTGIRVGQIPDGRIKGFCAAGLAETQAHAEANSAAASRDTSACRSKAIIHNNHNNKLFYIRKESL